MAITKVAKYRLTRGDSDAQTVKAKNTVDGVLAGYRDFVTGDTVYFTVKSDYYSDTNIFQKVITEFSDGAARLVISPEDTSGLEYGEYVYDFQIVFADGEVITPLRGAFIVDKEVTT